MAGAQSDVRADGVGRGGAAIRDPARTNRQGVAARPVSDRHVARVSRGAGTGKGEAGDGEVAIEGGGQVGGAVGREEDIRNTSPRDLKRIRPCRAIEPVGQVRRAGERAPAATLRSTPIGIGRGCVGGDAQLQRVGRAGEVAAGGSQTAIPDQVVAPAAANLSHIPPTTEDEIPRSRSEGEVTVRRGAGGERDQVVSAIGQGIDRVEADGGSAGVQEQPLAHRDPVGGRAADVQQHRGAVPEGSTTESQDGGSRGRAIQREGVDGVIEQGQDASTRAASGHGQAGGARGSDGAVARDLQGGGIGHADRCSGERSTRAELEGAGGNRSGTGVGASGIQGQRSGAQFGQRRTAGAGKGGGETYVLPIGIHTVSLAGPSAEAAGVVRRIVRGVLQSAAPEADGSGAAQRRRAVDPQGASIDRRAARVGVGPLHDEEPGRRLRQSGATTVELAQVLERAGLEVDRARAGTNGQSAGADAAASHVQHRSVEGEGGVLRAGGDRASDVAAEGHVTAGEADGAGSGCSGASGRIGHAQGANYDGSSRDVQVRGDRRGVGIRGNRHIDGAQRDRAATQVDRGS